MDLTTAWLEMVSAESRYNLSKRNNGAGSITTAMKKKYLEAVKIHNALRTA